jgi:hypothetical protein
MPYQQLEELTSRRREKVALFLTAENMAGLLAVGLPAYIGTTEVTSIWLRILILIAAAVLGVALTSEVHGMAFYERVLWWLRGQTRRRMTGAMIRPAEFTTAPTVQGDRALPLGGPLRRGRPPGQAGASDLTVNTRMSRVIQTAAVPRYRASSPQPTAGVPASVGLERETPVPDSHRQVSLTDQEAAMPLEQARDNVAGL